MYIYIYIQTMQRVGEQAPALELRFLGAGKGWGVFVQAQGAAIPRGAFVAECVSSLR